VVLGRGTNVGKPLETGGGGGPPVGMVEGLMGRGVAWVEDERVKLGGGTNVGKPLRRGGGGGPPVGMVDGLMGRGVPVVLEASSVQGSDVGAGGAAVTVVMVVSVVQGSLEKTGPLEMLGMPGSCVKAGALLGLKDSDAGSWRDELYGSGWSSSTGLGVGVGVGLGVKVGVGLTVDTRELIGSIVAPGATSMKLGRSGSPMFT
jgi:hypothetical protein